MHAVPAVMALQLSSRKNFLAVTNSAAVFKHDPEVIDVIATWLDKKYSVSRGVLEQTQRWLSHSLAKLGFV